MKALGQQAAGSRGQGDGPDVRRGRDGLGMRCDRDGLDMKGGAQGRLAGDEGHRWLVHACPLFRSRLPPLLRVECPQNTDPRITYQAPRSTLHTPLSTPPKLNTTWRIVTMRTVQPPPCTQPRTRTYTHGLGSLLTEEGRTGGALCGADRRGTKGRAPAALECVWIFPPISRARCTPPSAHVRSESYASPPACPIPTVLTSYTILTPYPYVLTSNAMLTPYPYCTDILY